MHMFCYKTYASVKTIEKGTCSVKLFAQHSAFLQWKKKDTETTRFYGTYGKLQCKIDKIKYLTFILMKYPKWLVFVQF
jgi:hypothetical protein